MDYFGDFLNYRLAAKPYLNVIQDRLISLLREGLIHSDAAQRGRLVEKSRRVIGFIEPTKRLALASDLPNSVLRQLWEIDATILLVPKGFDGENPGLASPDDLTLHYWLCVLDKAQDSTGHFEDQSTLLEVMQGLLKSLDKARRGAFLRTHPDLRVIPVRDARTRQEKAASARMVESLRQQGTLFGFAQGLGEARFGFTPQLARVLPKAEIFLVRAELYRDLLPDEEPLRNADAYVGCLAAVGKYAGSLGELKHRRELLSKANDPGLDRNARRGLRYLLHGSVDNRQDDEATLWIAGHDQHSAWSKLWLVTHESDEHWTRIDDDLANSLPRERWNALKIQEISPQSLINELLRSGRGIEAPEQLTAAEREEILATIDDRVLWQRLPLHTDINGNTVCASGDRVYCVNSETQLDKSLAGGATLLAASDNPRIAKKQKEWLRRLDDYGIINLALDTGQPDQHWQIIIESIGNLPSAWIDNDEFVGKLRAKPWLPTRHETPVKPDDVLDFKGSRRDAVHRLVDEHRKSNDFCYAVPEGLAIPLREHPVWQKYKHKILPQANLDCLALLLADLPRYAIGPLAKTPRREEMDLMAPCQEMPGWALLQQFSEADSDADQVWRSLSSGLTNPLAPERVFQALDWITSSSNLWKTRKNIYNQYLQQFVQDRPYVIQKLKFLRLASCNGKWRSPEELCTGTHGIESTWVLDRDQANILGDLIHHPLRPHESNQSDTNTKSVNFSRTLDATPKVLERYFRCWEGGLVPNSMIGFLVGLLGPASRKLARHYLTAPTFEGLRDRLPWTDPGWESHRQGWMGGKTLQEALDLIEAAVIVSAENTIDTGNLLGKQIKVPLKSIPNHLFSGIRWIGGYRFEIKFRTLDPNMFTHEDLSKLLQTSAELLYSKLYNQKKVSFDALWQELDKSNQLDIRVTRKLIISDIPLYLQQISLKGEELSKLRPVLNDLRKEQVRLCEVEEQQKDIRKRQDSVRLCLDRLSRLIEQDQLVQQAILSGMKGKLKQWEYQPSSIPFELFQNADDAAVELGWINTHSETETGGVPETAQRWVVECTRESLCFLHWGRCINALGPAGFDGENLGFHRDLEKMLILSASDKQEGVTGKFGLGFKSVLLACQKPRIISGRLALEIIAGILPAHWQEADREMLTRYATDNRTPGTLIELPALTVPVEDIMGECKRWAGLLCAFGRAIRRIEFLGDDSRHVDWTPLEILPGVEFGKLWLNYKEWGERTDAVCLRGATGSAVMFLLSPEGFREMPEDVPALWVTAPLGEKSHLGFAVNGPFDLDAGRGRLAADDLRNRELAEQIGREAGELLCRLLQQIHDDWQGLRESLGLVAELTPHDFLCSLWIGFSQNWLRRQRDDGVELGRAVAMTLLKSFGEHATPMIPNGLPPPFAALVSRNSIRYELAKCLAKPEVIMELKSWMRFTKRYSRNALVADNISAILKHIDDKKITKMGIPALLGVLESEVKPEDAKILGRVYLETATETDWATDDLKKRLKDLRFRTQNNSWRRAIDLLACDNSRGKEEMLRYDIAPPDRRLNPEYRATDPENQSALEFFYLCRDRMPDLSEDLAKWIRQAENAEQQYAALKYLAAGEHHEKLCNKLRGEGWLADVPSNQSLLNLFELDDQRKLKRLLATDDQVNHGLQKNAAPVPYYALNPINIAKALKQIHEWWDQVGKQRADEYRGRLYPSSSLNLNLDPESGTFDRADWLTLFALGAFQSIGRTKEEQHRDFIKMCQSKGWWVTFSAKEPQKRSGQWMEVIKAFADEQVDDEQWSMWISQFPKLYRLSYWLDDYVELFLSINKFNNAFQLNALLTPRTNPNLQGGGLDAPPINRTLRLGVHLVVRELLHHKIITTSHAIRHAYAPTKRMGEFFTEFGFVDMTQSHQIHDLLRKHLGDKNACFNGAYDIPLRLMAGDTNLQQEVLGRRITMDSYA